MRFGGQVHDMGDGMALHDFKDGILVAQVNLFEGVILGAGQRSGDSPGVQRKSGNRG